MLEKTIYLTTLYLAANKTALAIQVLATVIPALVKGVAVFWGKPARIFIFAALQAPVYWLLAELSTGEISFLLYNTLKPVIAWLGGEIYSQDLSDKLIVYGVPGLAHGLITAALCLWLLRRFKNKAGKRPSRPLKG